MYSKSCQHVGLDSLTRALAGVDSLAGGFLTPWMAVEDVKAGLRMDCWEETPKASAPARKTTTERAVKRMFGAGVVGDGAIGDGAIVRVVRFNWRNSTPSTGRSSRRSQSRCRDPRR